MKIHLDVHLHLASESVILDRLRHLSAIIDNQGHFIMTTLQDLKDSLITLKDDIAAEKAEVQSKLTDLKNQVQALQDQIANGGVVTQADLDDLAQQIAAIDTGVKDISEPEPVTIG